MSSDLRRPLRPVLGALLLALAGCASQEPARPAPPARTPAGDLATTAPTAADRAMAERLAGRLFHAAREEPDQHGLQVYVLFLDTGHFTAWRTRDAPAVVVGRLDHYLNEHPGTHILSRYQWRGGRLQALRTIATRGVSGLSDHDYADDYEGWFDGEQLTLVERSSSGPPGGPLAPISTVTWRLTPVTLPYTVPPMRPRAD